MLTTASFMHNLWAMAIANIEDGYTKKEQKEVWSQQLYRTVIM